MPSSEAKAPGVTEQLCQWIHQITLEDVPDLVQERAKHLILDGIACGLVGAHVPWSEEAFSAINQFEARGEHAIIGYEEVRCTPFLFHTTTLTDLVILITSASALLLLPSSTVHSYKPAN